MIYTGSCPFAPVLDISLAFFFSLQKDQDYEASIFTGEEEIFAFERTVSRLREMQGEEYWSMDRKIPRPSTQRT